MLTPPHGCWFLQNGFQATCKQSRPGKLRGCSTGTLQVNTTKLGRPAQSSRAPGRHPCAEFAHELKLAMQPLRRWWQASCNPRCLAHLFVEPVRPFYLIEQPAQRLTLLQSNKQTRISVQPPLTRAVCLFSLGHCAFLPADGL